MKMHEIIAVRLMKQSVRGWEEKLSFLNNPRAIKKITGERNSFFAISEFTVEYGHSKYIEDRVVNARSFFISKEENHPEKKEWSPRSLALGQGSFACYFTHRYKFIRAQSISMATIGSFTRMRISNSIGTFTSIEEAGLKVTNAP